MTCAQARRRVSWPFRLGGSWLALAALVMQLLAASAVLPMAAPEGGPDPLASGAMHALHHHLHHAATAPDKGQHGPHAPCCPCCPCCPLCRAVAHVTPLLPPPVVVAIGTPQVMVARAAPPSSARAPPSRIAAAAWPRGPPRLI